MSVLSVLRGVSSALKPSQCMKISVRQMGGPNKMVITPSRWQWHKTKDMLHFYVCVAAIPLAILTTWANVFIGPAKLTPIPEGYVPENHEYFKSPITRFISKYCWFTYQEEYERQMHVNFVEDEMKQMRLLEQKVTNVIKDKQDVQGYFYNPVITKYHKLVRRDYENLRHFSGENN